MPGSRQAGFSLLEMLVTLIVIVLITSLVSLAVNSGGQEIQLEAKVRNLGEVGAYAVDEAQLIGRDYGLLLQQEVVERDTVYSYQWRERLPEGWRAPTTGKDVFAGQTLPPGIELELELEGAPVAELGLEGAEEELRSAGSVLLQWRNHARHYRRAAPGRRRVAVAHRMGPAGPLQAAAARGGPGA